MPPRNCIFSQRLPGASEVARGPAAAARAGAEMKIPPELTTRRDEHHGSRIGDIIRGLATDNTGEMVARMRGLYRILSSAGCDFHDLAEHIEASNGHNVTEADLKKVLDTGYAMGVRDTENKLHGAHDFVSADGKPPWEAVALFLQREKIRLDSKHHQFVDDMASRTVWGREPTERQHKYLHSLFFKLGGKIK
jgi:hypothetical protein